MAFKQNISKSIQYPLPALTLTKSECNYVVAPIVQASLQNLRISSKYPRSLVYASNTYNGLGFFNIYTLMGTSMWNSFFIIMSLPVSQENFYVPLSNNYN